MDQPLRPAPRLWLRAVLLAVILAVIPFARAPWAAKAPAMLLWAVTIGSYRVARIDAGTFRTGYVVGFVPVNVRRLKLDRVSRIGVDVEESLGIGWGCLVGWLNWVLIRLLDWIFPWLGGRYRVWLVTHKGRKVLAWQGNSEDALRANLDMLENATGLTTERSGFSP